MGFEPECVGVVLARLVSQLRSTEGRGVVRFIGLDVHRDFCEIAISEGGKARSAGRVQSSPEELRVLGQSLLPDDKVILESTGTRLRSPGCSNRS